MLGLALPYQALVETEGTEDASAMTTQAWAMDRRFSVSAGVSLPMKNVIWVF